MKKQFIIILFVLFSLLIVGYQEDKSEIQLKESREQVIALKNDINDKEKKISELTNLIETYKSNEQKQLDLESVRYQELEKELKALSENYNLLKVEHELLRTKIRNITNLSLEYKILSDKPDRRPTETVVYIKNVSEDVTVKEEEIIVLKAAILFSGEKYDEVSFWDNEHNAKKYISGQYDNEETLFGWSGFHSKFGELSNSKQSLLHFLSPDDVDILLFGKYQRSD